MAGTRVDSIVIGLGVMGAASAAHMARRGQRVLGFDAYPRGHTQGSSHGRSRIIREAYFEAPEYVPLVQRAYKLWRDLEEASAQTLLTTTGGLCTGSPESSAVSGALQSAELHGLPHELLSAAEVTARFPGFSLAEEMVGVLEPRAGVLHADRCVAALLDIATQHGADLHHDEPVIRWSANGQGVHVETAAGSYLADRLVVTTGPWASELLAELALPLQVQRVVNAHFESRQPERFAAARFPVFIMQVAEGHYYGMPFMPGQGVKIGRHDNIQPCTPQTIRRDIDPAEIETLRGVLDRYLPGAAGPVMSSFTCMYTSTPDRHFILDRHPEHPQVVYGCGFSGHGFKFAPVIGEVLSDLAVEGATSNDVAFLSAARLALSARG
jgi:sarcosine oxidase